MKITNLIIGAGPAGLAVAGRMRKQGIDFEMIEQTDKIAYAWHQHYERLHLHTVKQLSNLPHLDFPEHYPLYVPRAQVVEYMESYAKTFDIQPHFNQEVISISKTDSGDWAVKTKSNNNYITKNVIIATGMNRRIFVPYFEGEENYQGTIIHSRDYKNAEPYRGKKVLVIGMGNTGAEIALDLSENNAQTFIAVRSPLSLVPRDLNGRPVQLTAKKLAKLPFGLGDWLGGFIRKIYFGDLRKYGLESLKIPPVTYLRETGKSPMIDIGTIKAIKAGQIKVLKKIDCFYEKGVKFENGEKIEFDNIILATGYRAKIDDFLERAEEVLDKYHLPCPPIGTGYHQGVFFNGYDNYKLGGALGTIFTDSKTIVDFIKNQ